MKIITMSKIGYNAPSQANWCWNIWKIDLIETDNPYNMSYTVKEQFGGDSRLKEELKKENIETIETKQVYTGTGTQKITGIAGIKNMESKELSSEIIDWYKN